RKSRVTRIVYASTTGVYGDAGGARFDETRTPRPATDRARRRADAEARLRWYGQAFGARVSILRIPGIYAADRPGGHPREPVERVHLHRLLGLAAHDDQRHLALGWRAAPQRRVEAVEVVHRRAVDAQDLVAGQQAGLLGRAVARDAHDAHRAVQLHAVEAEPR